jgi:signal transduction histidine kinase
LHSHGISSRRDDAGILRAARAHLAATVPESTLDELRRNNQDLIAALEDVTRQKEQLQLLNGELQETNRGVMALYSELSEELEQTNRGVVALYGELDDKSEQLYQVGLIKNSAGTLLALVNDLLDVAKAESGQIVIDPTEVSLPPLLATLRGLTRPMTEGKPVEVTVSAQGAPAVLLTDEAALTAILRNLLSNAVKYTDQGEVRLTVRTTADSVEIQVSDTGTGIPAGQGTTAVPRLPHGLPQAGTVLVADDDPAFRQVLKSQLAGLDVPRPPRAAALLRKDEITRERLAYAVRRAVRDEL